MKPIKRRPTPVSSVAGLVMGLLAVVANSPYTTVAFTISAVGFLLLLLGIASNTRQIVTTGSVGLFVGSVGAGTGGAPVPVTLFSIVATVLAYDFTTTAIDLGEQLGRKATVQRLETARILTSSIVGIVTGTTGYLVYEIGTGGQPLSAVIALLLAVVFFFAALRREPVEER